MMFLKLDFPHINVQATRRPTPEKKIKSWRHQMATPQNSEMPYRTLGHTGEKVSIIGLGGFHIGTQNNENDSIRIIRTAIDNGVNFMDNSWDYNDGVSEIRMGKALRDGFRNKVFLMTKIDGHTFQAATTQLDESLQRLQTDTIDLLQFHEMIRITDPEKIFSPGGSMEALLAARKAGKIRYIGFTGHKSPDIHLRRCCKQPWIVASYLTQFRCHLMSWMLASKALKKRFCQWL
jgi:aryl-alcohol dehydrogenase-like predicted oxidoreductase